MSTPLRCVSLAVLMCASACDQWLTQPVRYNTVEVSAMRRNGEAIAGVALELYTGQRPMGYGTTDATGRYRFTLVPDGLYGVRAIQPAAYAAVEELTGGAPTTSVSGLVLASDTVARARFTFLKRGAGAVAVLVHDDANVPVVGMFAALYDPHGFVAAARTDATGRVTFASVPFGVYGVSIPRPPGFRDLDESAFVAHDGLIVESGGTDTAAFTLARCAGTITVNVREDNGNPVAPYPVSLYTSAATVDDGFTAATGAKTFAVTCGDFGVRLVPLAGWSYTEGRGTSFADGLHVTRAAALSVTFVVRRN